MERTGEAFLCSLSQRASPRYFRDTSSDLVASTLRDDVHTMDENDNKEQDG